MQKPTLKRAHVGLQGHSQNGKIRTYASANQSLQTQAENLVNVGACVDFVTKKILDVADVILWYILIVERQPTRKAHHHDQRGD